MAELVYALDLKSSARKGLWVRVPLGLRNYGEGYYLLNA